MNEETCEECVRANTVLMRIYLLTASCLPNAKQVNERRMNEDTFSADLQVVLCVACAFVLRVRVRGVMR